MVIILGIFASVTATVVGVYLLTSNSDQNELEQALRNTSNDQDNFKDITKINETGSDDYEQVSGSIINELNDEIEDKENDTKDDKNIVLMVGGFSGNIRI